MTMSIKNTQGSVFFGIHFYPGVAEYQEPGKDMFRVFLNEKTIRSMDPDFAGKPVFVEHVEGVEPSIDELRKEADGWVIRSFYNAADGKHWCEFIIVSERGLRAVKNGMRLSNAYLPKTYAQGGMWNGVSYDKEITSAEYEHLALVNNPRYEESVILSTEDFKKYNEDHQMELKRLANSKEEQGESKMGLNFFKRAKIENALDIESTVVQLPKSKKEMTISELVEAHDKIVNMHGYASEDHMVKVGENEMSVKDLVKKHMDQCNEMEEMKKNSEASEKEDEEAVGDRGGDKALDKAENAEESDLPDDAKEDEKKKNAILKAKALKNAGAKPAVSNEPKILLPQDKLALGRELF